MTGDEKFKAWLAGILMGGMAIIWILYIAISLSK